MAEAKKSGSKKIELKWKHYVYEFFIVALGISVPFMLSKCNENKILRNTEKIYMDNIKEELILDSAMIHGNHTYNQMLLENSIKIIDLINSGDRSKADSIGRRSMLLTEFSDFHKRGSLYETLAKSGELDILTNLELIYSLGELDELYTYINRLEENNNELIFLTFSTMSENIQIQPFAVKNEEAIFDYRFNNLVNIYKDMYIEKDSLYNEALMDLGEIITSLQDDSI